MTHPFNWVEAHLAHDRIDSGAQRALCAGSADFQADPRAVLCRCLLTNVYLAVTPMTRRPVIMAATFSHAFQTMTTLAATPATAATPDLVPVLLARVYAEAPPPLKSRLLEQLLKPLGLLSLAAVCNGAFASLAFSKELAGLRIRPELAQSVGSEQVAVLAGYVQQVSFQAISGLSQLLSNSPVLQGSVAASALVAVLVQRAREQPTTDQSDFDVFGA
jgi:hypothetical protein